MEIKKVTDPAFSKYGKVITYIDVSGLLAAMADTEAPDGVVYVPSVPALEALPAFLQISEQAYGGMPIQIGYCNGKNHTLNAVEYHRDSELNLACADIILLIGSQQDVVPGAFTYDTALMEGVPRPGGHPRRTLRDHAPLRAHQFLRQLLPRGGRAAEGHQRASCVHPRKRGRAQAAHGDQQMAHRPSRQRYPRRARGLDRGKHHYLRKAQDNAVNLA